MGVWVLVNQTKRKSVGGVTLLVLVMLLFFVIVFGTVLTFISRQSTLTVDQEQEEQAFGLADAGVTYTLWLLDANGANLEVSDLEEREPVGPALPIVDTSGVELGTFEVTYESESADTVRARSKGFDQVRPERCQVIDAVITRFVSGAWQVTHWNHFVSRSCGDLPDL